MIIDLNSIYQSQTWIEIDTLNILELQQKNQNGLKVSLFVNNATRQIEKNTSLVIEEKMSCFYFKSFWGKMQIKCHVF